MAEDTQSPLSVERDSVILEEDREQVVVRHRVVRKEGECDDKGHDGFVREDAVGRHSLRRPLRRGRRESSLGVIGVEGPIRAGSHVHGRPLHCVRRFNQRRFSRDVSFVWHKDARLHVGVGLLEEEVSQYDAQKQERGADEVREEVWKPVEEAAFGEEVRVGLARVRKCAADRGPDDGTDGPNEG